MASGLAPRWAAKQPQKARRVSSDKLRWTGLGLLRSPARGKPARHRGVLSLQAGSCKAVTLQRSYDHPLLRTPHDRPKPPCPQGNLQPPAPAAHRR
ncbi:hypothetical protein GDV60_17705 [Pseudomonas sp. DTU12.1]|nr:hypothetical protein GDV60_17705 [Pseudomonas sp. DTU12.1]